LPYKISIIGSGNVAWHLAHALDTARHTILQVYSRNTESAKRLAKPFNAQVVNSINQLTDDIDVLLLCISDDAIETVAPQLVHHRSLIAHTSGAMDMELLKNTSPYYGVFYPLQTLSAGKKINFYEVPICVEGSNSAAEKQLFALGNTISNKVQYIDSAQRKYLHLAAVFANNFTNALYAEAAEILEQQNLNFDLLRPLILETAQKIQKLAPQEAQTGPAKRHDENTISKHLKLMTGSEKAEIYQLITKIIKNKF